MEHFIHVGPGFRVGNVTRTSPQAAELLKTAGEKASLSADIMNTGPLLPLAEAGPHGAAFLSFPLTGGSQENGVVV